MMFVCFINRFDQNGVNRVNNKMTMSKIINYDAPPMPYPPQPATAFDSYTEPPYGSPFGNQ